MLKNLVRLIVVLTLVAAIGGVSYLTYAAVALCPPAEAVARQFLGHLCAGDAGAAYELLDPRVRIAQSRDAFMADVGRRAVYYSSVRGLALAGQDLDGMSHITMRGPVAYGPGLSGDVTISLAKGEAGWRVLSHDVSCPQLLDALKERALKHGYAFLEAMRGGDFAALTALMDPTAVQRMGEPALRAQQATLSRHVDDSRFMESRTHVDFPRYGLHGVLRTSDGLPYEVDVQITWRGGDVKVTDFHLEPSAGWLAEQRHVARQVAANFVAAMKTGSAPEMIGACHPKLVEALGRARFEQMAAEYPAKLADITFDDARSSANHPIYEIVGIQKTLAGAELPASLRIQYVDGSYVITALSFD